jgi:hypothetical protein
MQRIGSWASKQTDTSDRAALDTKHRHYFVCQGPLSLDGSNLHNIVVVVVVIMVSDVGMAENGLAHIT